MPSEAIQIGSFEVANKNPREAVRRSFASAGLRILADLKS